MQTTVATTPRTVPPEAAPDKQSPTSGELAEDLTRLEAEEQEAIDRREQQELSRLREPQQFD